MVCDFVGKLVGTIVHTILCPFGSEAEEDGGAWD